jgi:hypothetical protein
MISTTVQAIVDQAAENAGRTRDKVPPSEGVMMRGWLDTHLQTIWEGAVWPELLKVSAAAVAVADHAFSKNEGTAGELGDVLGYYERQPHRLDETPWFDFNEGDNVVRIDGHRDSVWPVYQLPCPDLTAVAAADLAAYTLPRRFKAYLAYMVGGELAKADGDAALAGVNYGLAEKALGRAQQRAWDALPVWLKRPRWGCRHHHHHRPVVEAAGGGAPPPPGGGVGIGGEGGGGMA